jgi:hypothetical protein
VRAERYSETNAVTRLRQCVRLIVVAFLVVSCENVPTVVPSPSPTSPARFTPSNLPPTVRIWLDEPRYYVLLEREMVVDGDRTLLLGFDFSVPMRQTEVEDRLRATMPAGTSYQWPSPEALRVNVPAGDSFDIALTGARSQGGSALAAAAWHIARPVTGIALYRPDQTGAWPTPTRSWQVRMVVQNGTPRESRLLIFAPDGESALLYHGNSPRQTKFSLVNLATGQHLAEPFSKIASSGWTVMDWTADRRLLVVGGNETWLADERGGNPVALRALPAGQGGLLSPSRRYLYLWSCTVGEAWMLDLAAGREWRLGDEQLPCAPGSSVVWTPADELAIGDASAEASPSFRIRIFEAAGRLRRTMTGFRPVVALAGGAFVVGHRVATAHRDDGGPFYLLDTHGVEHVLPAVYFRPSPDGRFLAFTSWDGDTPIANVWRVSGDPPLTMRDAWVTGWTKDGALAIVTVVRP